MAQTIGVNAKTKRGKIVVNIALTVLAIYLFTLGIGTYIKIREKKAAISNQDTQISIKTTESEQLQNTLDAQVDLEYVEKIAREKGGYVNPDEKVYESITD